MRSTSCIIESRSALGDRLARVRGVVERGENLVRPKMPHDLRREHGLDELHVERARGSRGPKLVERREHAEPEDRVAIEQALGQHPLGRRRPDAQQHTRNLTADRRGRALVHQVIAQRADNPVFVLGERLGRILRDAVVGEAPDQRVDEPALPPTSRGVHGVPQDVGIVASEQLRELCVEDIRKPLQQPRGLQPGALLFVAHHAREHQLSGVQVLCLPGLGEKRHHRRADREVRESCQAARPVRAGRCGRGARCTAALRCEPRGPDRTAAARRPLAPRGRPPRSARDTARARTSGSGCFEEPTDHRV